MGGRVPRDPQVPGHAVQAVFVSPNPASRARIDMCMDNFTNYVFLKCYGGVANCVIGELLGLQEVYPYPADQEAANAAFVEALEKWTGLYLTTSGPFVCGEELTIA